MTIEFSEFALKAMNAIKAKKERKIQPTAVPPDTLPKRCTMTMHHEISASGSLMPAADGSAMFYDTLSPTRQ